MEYLLYLEKPQDMSATSMRLKYLVENRIPLKNSEGKIINSCIIYYEGMDFYKGDVDFDLPHFKANGKAVDLEKFTARLEAIGATDDDL